MLATRESPVNESALMPVFDMLVTRLGALEEAAQEQREAQLHANEYAPAGTVVRGAIYRGPHAEPLMIVKHYDTPAPRWVPESNDMVFYVDYQFSANVMGWMPTSEWAHGVREDRTWRDDLVEQAIGVDKAAQIRRTLAACFDATPPLDVEKDDITCGHAGLPETHTDFYAAWSEWAILRRFPDVVAVDLAGMIIHLRHDAPHPLRRIIEIVDQIFDLDGDKPTHLDVYRIPAPFKDHAARWMRLCDTTKADVKLIWSGLNAGQRADALKIMRNVRTTSRPNCMMNFDFEVLSKLV